MLRRCIGCVGVVAAEPNWSLSCYVERCCVRGSSSHIRVPHPQPRLHPTRACSHLRLQSRRSRPRLPSRRRPQTRLRHGQPRSALAPVPRVNPGLSRRPWICSRPHSVPWSSLPTSRYVSSGDVGLCVTAVSTPTPLQSRIADADVLSHIGGGPLGHPKIFINLVRCAIPVSDRHVNQRVGIAGQAGSEGMRVSLSTFLPVSAS